MHALTRYFAEDDGQDLVEYALLTGVFGLVAVVVFNNLSNIMNAAYASWDNATQLLWQPQDPQ